MQIEWNRNQEADGRPVYAQIAAAVRAAIARDGLGSGTRLPAIRDLARDLGVHRDTVATAYEALAADGVVESTVGRGTFVVDGETTRAPEVAPFAPELSPVVERLLEFERARPRFGSARDAIAMHALIPDPSLYPAARLCESALPVTADELVLCHGASQGIALALRLFCAPGDVIALEEPTYNNVLGAALALGLRTAPVPMTEGGVDLARLEQTLARPEVKAFYTIPTFHNPMGTTTNLAHRHALLALARRAGVPVIEDGYEMDLRFAGAPVAPLAGLDTSGVVVHLFSFSKSLFPGARVGAVTARGRLREALLALKHASDLSDALPLQAALAEFVACGEYDRHLSRLRRVLRGRRDALLEALAEHMPEGSRWTTPEGGYQVWLELPGGLDTRDLLADAVASGVLFAPGSQFYSDGRPSNGMRLAFAMAGEDALRSGVERLARVIAAHRANGAPATGRVPV